MIGQRFAQLVVLGPAGKTAWNELLWRCACDCGHESVVQGKRLRSGGTRSCGCLVRRNGVTHDGRHTRLYRVWRGMIGRCENAASKDFYRYGGAGVVVCRAWRDDFAAFRRWATEHGYGDGLFIDRIDPAGHYEPDNCRWLSPADSARNTRAVKLSFSAADRIRTLVAAGASHSTVAAQFGVCRASVSLVCEGKAWTR